jgi:hypothetical protein
VFVCLFVAEKKTKLKEFEEALPQLIARSNDAQQLKQEVIEFCKKFPLP